MADKKRVVRVRVPATEETIEVAADALDPETLDALHEAYLADKGMSYEARQAARDEQRREAFERTARTTPEHDPMPEETVGDRVRGTVKSALHWVANELTPREEYEDELTPPTYNPKVRKTAVKPPPAPILLEGGKVIYPDPPKQDEGVGSGEGGGGFWGAARRAMTSMATGATPAPKESFADSVRRRQSEEQAAADAKKEPLISFGLPEAVDDNTLRSAEEVFKRAGIPLAIEGRPGYSVEDVEELARSGGRNFHPDSKMTGEQREALINRVAPGQSLESPDVLKAQRGASVPPDQVVVPPMPDGAPGQTMTGFNFSGSTMPGAVGPSATEGTEARMAATSEQQANALRNQAELEGKRLEETAKLQQRAIDNSMASQQKIQQTQELRRAAVEDARRAYEKTLAQMQDPAVTVDQNAFWNDRSTGQKILAAASVMLGGLGQGTFAALGIKSENGALEIMKDAIKRDLEVQQTNIENKRGMAKDLAMGQHNLYNMLRQEGMDEIEALRSEEAAKIDLVQRQIEQLAAQMGTPEARAKAELAIATLEQEKNKLLFDVAQHRDSFAINKANLAVKRFAIGVKAAQGGGAKPASPAMIKQAEGLAELQRDYVDMDRLGKEFDKVSGLAQKAAGVVPKTEANKFNAASRLLMRRTAISIDKSVLQKHDIEDWENWWPKAGDLNGATKIALIKRMVRETHDLRLKALRDVGAATGNLQTIGGSAPNAYGTGTGEQMDTDLEFVED